MTPRTACLVLLAALTGCARRGPSTIPALSPTAERAQLIPKVAQLSHEAEAVLTAQDELVWKSWTEGTAGDIARAYAGHEAAFSPESVAAVRRLRQLSRDPKEVRALTYLETYLAGEYLARATEELSNAVANLEASLTFSAEGRELRYRDLDRMLANEHSPARRHLLYEAATPAVERLSQMLRRRQEKTEALAMGLGYPSYEAFGAELRQADLTQLGLLADEVLSATQEPFMTVLGRLSQAELQLPLAKLSRADIPRLFRPRGVDAFFPKNELMSRAASTLQGMGLALAGLKNIHLDLKDSPRKNPRGLTLAVAVPDDVRVSLKLKGGVRDQRALFHELGHALHDGLTGERRFELARLGDSAVSEAFSFLFEDLTEDPIWLERQAGLSGEKLAEYLATASASKLYLVRRAAGKLLYQLALHRGAAEDARALYASVMGRTYGLPMSTADTARYVLDDEELYASADGLRAWCLAAQLQGQLKARFGPAWWQSAGAGDYLKGLMAPGNALSAEELSRKAGERGVAPDVLLLRLAGTLQVPIALPGGAPPLRARPASAPPAMGAPDAGRAPQQGHDVFGAREPARVGQGAPDGGDATDGGTVGPPGSASPRHTDAGAE